LFSLRRCWLGLAMPFLELRDIHGAILTMRCFS
jgi:hypothetical protein